MQLAPRPWPPVSVLVRDPYSRIPAPGRNPVARPNQATTTPRATSERVYSQATEQLRRQARATRDLAERYHEQYRRSLESWVALRSRLQNRNGNGHGDAPTTRSASSRRTSAVEILRADHDALAREVA